ncbi:CLUMA_CG004113, isoform A [Clunio marinus]|uniref:CLUMA_CG004113, isoform A n=1 Tax=Clunio marinus TaxID=568069 RepID=A0A1J1HQZ8_9DIPT|nr:CLUMA_CG004113, isoform A [Clunio marinus]
MEWKDLIEDAETRLKKYILDPYLPKLHDPKPHYHPRQLNDLSRLFHIPPCPENTQIVAQRDPQTGEIERFIEVAIENAGSDARNSFSLQRKPGPQEQATRGSAANFPFWPGGFDEPKNAIMDLVIDNTDFEENLLSVAPGFTHGIDFSHLKKSNTQNKEEESSNIDLLSVIESKDEDIFKIDVKSASTDANGNEGGGIITLSTQIDDSLLEIKPTQVSDVLKIKETRTQNTVAEWAEIIDISQPVKNFYDRVADMAHQYPFELDPFQKQAILKLENHNHVFVAAHTSAGKTVVAEYAIALSKKHMTKTIYTSPIKALSNQKYRDFKQTFGDVGLITGDIQIDSTANCLIMTTEILRSMLYCGSDVTRDLEYVIFDEVHYITDTDRGHVWEEVLILLPDHVCIVMLSATVPNTLEFANWVGKTKRKKVYVISTPKRPVPLQHFLYTGNGGKTKDDIFLTVDENGKFLSEGYEKAKSTKAARQKDFQKNFGSRTVTNLNPKQEQTMWVGLIDHLKRNNRLPVVAFTLSRNRCDSNAEALKSCDLTNTREKFKINSFFQLCLQKLKSEDRQLPQVKTIQDCLQRGIGIHHSGILPILKEIVEMCFQCGLVKLLFATETFAMGVNMPARTVIFDSISKFDGKSSRNLEPAEYTQMAGRAGRRGLDTTGTVIILCKTNIPDSETLKRMILGKPMRLESQFRLTYAMILSLLRVERVSVEDMMQHSFREFGKQLKVPENEKQLKIAEEKLSELMEISEHLSPLCNFYVACSEFFKLNDELMVKFVNQQKIFNEMKAGRILLVTQNRHYNKLGILLATITSTQKESTYKVLVLDNPHVDDSQAIRTEMWHRMTSYAYSNKFFVPSGATGDHTILIIKAENIVEITKITIKCEADKIIQNWEQRQIPRFKDSPPSPSVVKAVGELYELTMSVADNSEAAKLEIIPLTSQGFELMEDFKKLNELKDNIKVYQPYTNIPNFIENFTKVFDRKALEEKKENLLFQLSNKNLSLYPDYCNKLLVLQELKYIDDLHQVAMKGRVACEMGQNELIITELVLRNILTNLQPPEIAALLSSLVFQAKTDVEPNVTETLKKMMLEFQEVDLDIRKVEAKYNVGKADETVEKDKLNFGLIEVVYEWARNKPFAEIMQLTDIKEGVIVRCIQQLHETLRDVKDAARIIGDPVLHSKMEEASNAIKRDIVFAASLYTSSDALTITALDN